MTNVDTKFVIDNVFLYMGANKTDCIVTSIESEPFDFVVKAVSFLDEFIDVNESSLMLRVVAKQYVKLYKIHNKCILELDALSNSERVIARISDINFTPKVPRTKYLGLVIVNPRGRFILKVKKDYKIYLDCTE